MASQKKMRQKNLELQRPGNPNRTQLQHNPSRLDPQNQQSKRHGDKLSRQKKQK